MLNSSLMDIIRKLSPQELKGLNEYIHSSFFNKNKNVQKLFVYVSKQYPDFPPDKMNKEYVFKKLFPGEKFNDGFMRTLIFIITKLAEDYLAYLNFSGDKYNLKVSLLQELSKRNIDRILIKNLKVFEKDFSREVNLDDKYYRALFELEKVRNISQILKDKTLNQKELKEDRSLKILDYNITQFLISAMVSYIFVLNRMALVKIDQELAFLDEVIGYMKANIRKYSGNSLLMLLFNHLMLTLEPDNENYYFEMKKVVLDPDSKLNQIDRYNGIIGMQNFCLRQSNAGKKWFQLEFFNMLDFIIEGGYYTHEKGGDFVPQNFKNFVIVGTNLREFDWTENFIKNYAKKLNPEQRENAYNFSMAKLNFTKRDFIKALGFISRVSYQDLYYKLEVRYYTLMIYYELSMFSEAYDLIESYKKYILNNKMLNAKLKARHISFIRFANDLLKMKLSGKFGKIRVVEKNIKNSANTIHIPWLLQKLEEFYKKLEKS